jgi:hypothetical protein
MVSFFDRPDEALLAELSRSKRYEPARKRTSSCAKEKITASRESEKPFSRPFVACAPLSRRRDRKERRKIAAGPRSCQDPAAFSSRVRGGEKYYPYP